MAGLLEQLQQAFEGSGISVSVQAQVGPLQAVETAVSALTRGPAALSDLEGAIGSFPSPPGLDGLVALPGAFAAAGAAVPADPTGPLAPVLSLLGSLHADIRVSGTVSVVAGLDVVRHVLRLATGEFLSGANPMPVPPELWGRQPMAAQPIDIDTLRTRMAEAETQLGALPTSLDAATILALLMSVAPNRRDLNKWPALPVIGEVMEVMSVVADWRARSPEQLTQRLDADLRQVAELIATPRTRVAAPLLGQLDHAASAPEALRAAALALDPVLSGLRRKVTETGAQPGPTELHLLEDQVVALEGLAAAVAVDGTPLAGLGRLPRDLELQLMRVIRTVIPAYDPDLLTRTVDGVLALIPEADPAPLADGIQAIRDLDLSFLTDPLSAVRTAVEEAAGAIRDAIATAGQAVADLLSPVDGALADALDAAHLDDVRAALTALPGQIQAFVDGEVEPAVEPIRQAVSDAVDALTEASHGFDPSTLIDPIRSAIDSVASATRSEEVTAAVEEVRTALQTTIQVVAELDLSGPADEVIQLLGEAEEKLSELDPNAIPAPVQPVVKGFVDAVADVDFTHDVAEPMVTKVVAAVGEGPAAVLASLEDLMAALRTQVDRFRPSVAIGPELEAPFREVMETLDEFRPSNLLDRVAGALRDLVSKVQLLDADAVIAPLVHAHAELEAEIQGLHPEALLAPVHDAIASAVNALMESTGADEVFDGIDEVLGLVNSYVEALDEVRSVLSRLGQLLANPGTVEAALDDLVETTVARLDGVSLAALAPAFEACAQAVHAADRDLLAADLAGSFDRAATAVPAALAGSDAARVRDLARAFPLERLKAERDVPSRRRLIDLIERLVRVADGLDAAGRAWPDLAERLRAMAPDLQPRLVTYARLSTIDGAPVFAEFSSPPATVDQLKGTVRVALRDGLRLPVTTLYGFYAKVAPHLSGLVTGLAELIDAVHDRMADLTGDQGIGGVAASVEGIVDLIRDLDLSPLTAPLESMLDRIDGALEAIDPAPLGDVLRAAAQAVAGVLQLSTLISEDEVAALDLAYDEAVSGLRALSPGQLVADVLDPVYEDALGPVLEFLDLPAELRALVTVGADQVSAEITAQLDRVEVAFDRMLHAIPFGGGQGGEVSVSVSVSASATVGAA